jgi:hypothetical protein
MMSYEPPIIATYGDVESLTTVVDGSYGGPPDTQT